VYRAVQALRNGEDPKQAGQLLERYQAKHPDGSLAEEAMALSIEAALAKGDPSSRALAARYLARYPNGRFKKTAERALSGAKPQ
jgi:outer membrane protein assembly factor BamD (BamD/ComL family)